MHFSAAGYTVNENAGTILIPVTLNPASLITATVNFITWDGTATAGSDYTTISGTLTFPPGVTSRTFSVSILDDLLFEGDETAYLYLTTVSMRPLPRQIRLF